MPQQPAKPPTREQFEAAAEAVAKTAPAGLSEADFFALVDKHIAQNPPAAEEASTGGFLGNLGSNVVDVVSSIPKALHAATTTNPITTATNIGKGMYDRAKQVIGDIHPGAAVDRFQEGDYLGALGNLLPVKEAYERPAEMAMDATGAGLLARGGLRLAKYGAGAMRRPPVPPSTGGPTIPGGRPATGSPTGPTIPGGRPKPATPTAPVSPAAAPQGAATGTGAGADLSTMLDDLLERELGGGVAKAADELPTPDPRDPQVASTGYTGPERRGPRRIDSEANDLAYDAVRRQQGMGLDRPSSHRIKSGEHEFDVDIEGPPDRVTAIKSDLEGNLEEYIDRYTEGPDSGLDEYVSAWSRGVDQPGVSNVRRAQSATPVADDFIENNLKSPDDDFPQHYGVADDPLSTKADKLRASEMHGRAWDDDQNYRRRIDDQRGSVSSQLGMWLVRAMLREAMEGAVNQGPGFVNRHLPTLGPAMGAGYRGTKAAVRGTAKAGAVTQLGEERDQR